MKRGTRSAPSPASSSSDRRLDNGRLTPPKAPASNSRAVRSGSTNPRCLSRRGALAAPFPDSWPATKQAASRLGGRPLMRKSCS